MSQEELHNELRRWAKGSYTLEAGLELLIHQGKVIYDRAPWIKPRFGSGVWLDTDVLYELSGAFSSGERAVVDVALSLMSNRPVSLNDAAYGLDRKSTALVLSAIAHAAGFHQDTSHLPAVYHGGPAMNPWPTPHPTTQTPSPVTTPPPSSAQVQGMNL